MSEALLELTQVASGYGNIEALHGIDIKVKEGEIVSLIGANGAGKTTTLRTISGIVPLKSGSIKYLNQDVSKMAPDSRVHKGLIHVPEGRRLFPDMTVEENLEMGAYTRNDQADIKETMEHCFKLFPRLKERRLQRAGTMSGGEQQMAAIARGLMAKPKILMLDEPSLGLAPIIVQQIFEIIRTVNKEEGVTILLVEQNASLALKTADRAYVLETGNITLSGKGAELLEDEAVKRSYLGG